jgi:hypothetical protein
MSGTSTTAPSASAASSGSSTQPITVTITPAATLNELTVYAKSFISSIESEPGPNQQYFLMSAVAKVAKLASELNPTVTISAFAKEIVQDEQYFTKWFDDSKISGTAVTAVTSDPRFIGNDDAGLLAYLTQHLSQAEPGCACCIA